MTKEELIIVALRAGACLRAFRWARGPEASWETLPPDWAYWLRTHCTLDAEARRRAEEAACRSPRCAYELRTYCPDLDDDARRLAEEAACRDPEWAYRLYIGCTDLDAAAKSRVRAAAMRSPLW